MPSAYIKEDDKHHLADTDAITAEWARRMVRFQMRLIRRLKAIPKLVEGESESASAEIAAPAPPPLPPSSQPSLFGYLAEEETVARKRAEPGGIAG